MKRILPCVLAASLAALNAAPAGAQTLSGAMAADPMSAYQAFKAVNDAAFKPGYNVMENDSGEYAFDLIDCGENLYNEQAVPAQREQAQIDDAAAPAAPEDRLSEYQWVAHYVVLWSRSLKGFGYPAAVWAPIVSRYEADSLAELKKPAPAVDDASDEPTAMDRIETTAQEALVKALSDYRAAHPKMRLKSVTAEGGCGAADTEFVIASRPKGATMHFIPVFFYKLCQAQKIDPDDLNRCDRWREVAEGVASYMSGDYAYSARWPDGVTRRGRMRFDGDGDRQTITLTKPGR